MLLDIVNHGMKAKLLIDRITDPETTKRFKQLLSNMSETDVCVWEIGAHQGYYSLIAANILESNNDIHAIEPDLRNVERIKKNAELNKYENITVHPIAVGSEYGQTSIQLSNRTYLSKVGESEGETTVVNIMPFDELIDDSDRPLIIRLDAEYYEKEILSGMSKLLQSKRDIVIFGELHHSKDYTGSDILSELKYYDFEYEILEDISVEKAEEANKNIEFFAERHYK